MASTSPFHGNQTQHFYRGKKQIWDFLGSWNDRIVFNSLENIIDKTELFDDENEEMKRNEETYDDFQLALSDLAG